MTHHVVDLTGAYRSNIYTTARAVLRTPGLEAKPEDTLEIRRDGKVSMSGSVGYCAKWTVREKDTGGIRLERWKPYKRADVKTLDGV